MPDAHAVSLVDDRRAIKQLCQDERIARLALCARSASELVHVLLESRNDAAAIHVELPRSLSAQPNIAGIALAHFQW